MNTIFEIETPETFNNVLEEILDNLYGLKTVPKLDIDQIDPLIVQSAKDDLKKLLSSNDFNIDRISEKLKNTGVNSNKINLFITLFDNKKTKILYETLLIHSSKYGETVIDFNWFLKLVMGINDLKSLNYPLLQLVFSTKSTNGDQKQRNFDFNKDMLFKLINLLENMDNLQ